MDTSNDIICHCQQILKSTLVEAINEGAYTVDEITKITGAGIACGTCIEAIEELIETIKK